MRAIRVDKDDLLKKVQTNRDAHRGIFEEAVEGYRKRSVEILEEHIQKIKAGKLEEVYVRLPRPSDHTKDYDRVIEMLEMHEDTSICEISLRASRKRTSSSNRSFRRWYSQTP